MLSTFLLFLVCTKAQHSTQNLTQTHERTTKVGLKSDFSSFPIGVFHTTLKIDFSTTCALSTSYTWQGNYRTDSQRPRLCRTFRKLRFSLDARNAAEFADFEGDTNCQRKFERSKVGTAEFEMKVELACCDAFNIACDLWTTLSAHKLDWICRVSNLA